MPVNRYIMLVAMLVFSPKIYAQIMLIFDDYAHLVDKRLGFV